MTTKIKSLNLVTCLILISIFSFGQKLAIKENVFCPESEENTTYNVSLCTSFEFPNDTARFNNEGKIIYHNTGSRKTFFTYNQAGLLEQKQEDVLYNSDGSNEKYKYDSYGNIIEKYYFLNYAWESHYSTEINNYVYKDSLLISAKKYFTDLSYNSQEIGGSGDTIKTSYYYDSLKRMVREEEYHTLYKDDNRIYRYAYYNKNELISINEYTPGSDTLKKSTVYSYDTEGNIISRKIIWEKTVTETFKYQNGKMIEKECPDEWSYDDKMIIFKYTYDTYGNVLTINKYSSNNEFISLQTERKYTYNTK